MRQYILLLLAALPALCTNAFSISNVYSANIGTCTQTSASNFSCMDGKPIVIGFSVSAQGYPYYFYGNFTALAPRNADYSNPVNVYGSQCRVSSSSTSICFVTIPSIPLTSLNGTVIENITLVMQSDQYPQISQNATANVTVNHYANSTTYTTVESYNQTMGLYMQMEPAYNYFCLSYNICNSSIGYPIAYAGSELSNATTALDSDEAANAYAYTLIANQSLEGAYVAFNAFKNTSNMVINQNLEADSLVESANSQFRQNANVLYNCNASEASGLNSSIAGFWTLPMINTTNASAAYLESANSINANVSSAVDRCTNATAGHQATSSSLGLSTGQLLPGKVFSIPLSYFAIIPVLVVIIYITVKIRESREIRRIRDDANRHDNSKLEGGYSATEEKGQTAPQGEVKQNAPGQQPPGDSDDAQPSGKETGAEK